MTDESDWDKIGATAKALADASSEDTIQVRPDLLKISDTDIQWADDMASQFTSLALDANEEHAVSTIFPEEIIKLGSRFLKLQLGEAMGENVVIELELAHGVAVLKGSFKSTAFNESRTSGLLISKDSVESLVPIMAKWIKWYDDHAMSLGLLSTTEGTDY